MVYKQMLKNDIIYNFVSCDIINFFIYTKNGVHLPQICIQGCDK